MPGVINFIFFGTPISARFILEHIAKTHNCLCVVTKPDAPKGRGNVLTAPPVKTWATGSGAGVLQPHCLRGADFAEAFAPFAAKADIAVVVAYGLILPENVLNAPRLGTVNAHFSLLPKYRGASPVARAVMNGESETGVTVMKIGKGLDTGDIILQEAVPITDADTGGALTERLTRTAAPLLARFLERPAEYLKNAVPQNHENATYAEKITRETEIIDFRASARDIWLKIRALAPAPCACAGFRGETVKITSARAEPRSGQNEPGRIIDVSKNGAAVETGDGVILIEEIKTPQGKTMSARDFLNGRRAKAGEFFS